MYNNIPTLQQANTREKNKIQMDGLFSPVRGAEITGRYTIKNMK